MDPTRIADTPSRRAIAARLQAGPTSSSRRQASARARSRTISGGSVGTGRGFDRRLASTLNRPAKFVHVPYVVY